jgi:hypothetical protein
MEVTMVWTEATRRQDRRDGLRYASNLTDAEWALIEPFMPAARRIGRPRMTCLRAVVEAILYLASTGCQWRQLPQEAVLHGSVGGRTEPTPSLCLSDADGLRASELKHPVQGMNCNGDLGSATPVGPRAQCIPDHAFKAADGGLHQSPTRVPGLLLPAHASMLLDAAQERLRAETKQEGDGASDRA